VFPPVQGGFMDRLNAPLLPKIRSSETPQLIEFRRTFSLEDGESFRAGVWISTRLPASVERLSLLVARPLAGLVAT
jgi:hypothetical protein